MDAKPFRYTILISNIYCQDLLSVLFFPVSHKIVIINVKIKETSCHTLSTDKTFIS